MRILAINDEPQLGGAAQLFRRTNVILRRAGHEVLELTGESVGVERNGHGEQAGAAANGWRPAWTKWLQRVNQELAANVRQLYDRRVVAHLDRLVDGAPVDVAHVHNLHGRLSTAVLPALKRRGIPIVYQVNDYYFFCNAYNAYNRRLDACCKRCLHGNVWWAIWYRCTNNFGPNQLGKSLVQAVRRAALVIARPWRHVDLFLVTSAQAGALLTEWGISVERQWRIYNAVMLEEFAIPTRLGDEVVFYGACLSTKGTETFLEALAHVDPDSRLGVYLSGMIPEYEARLRAVAARRGLHLHIDSSLSWQTGLRERVAAARAVVVPSKWWVTSENVVYEALLLGKAVIVSRAGGNAELVEEGETALLIDPGDAPALGRAINELRANSMLANRLGHRGRQRAKERFAEPVFLERLEAAYHRAAALAEARR